MIVEKGKVVNILMFVYFAFFSLPMILVCGFPWRYKWHWMYGIKHQAALLGVLGPVSSWAFLVMAIICYKKKLRLQAYVAAALFFWAAMTELFIILYIQLQERSPPIYPI